jgi:hypothetical protein
MEEKSSERATQDGDAIDHAESEAPQARFEQHAGLQERHHVERQVNRAYVQERSRHHAVPLAVGDPERFEPVAVNKNHAADQRTPPAEVAKLSAEPSSVRDNASDCCQYAHSD